MIAALLAVRMSFYNILCNDLILFLTIKSIFSTFYNNYKILVEFHLLGVLPWAFSHFVRLKAIVGVFGGIFLDFQSV